MEEDRGRWRPGTLSGRVFKQYLRLPDHPAKVRLENWLGRTVFGGGFLLERLETKLLLDANDWMTRILIRGGSWEPHSLRLATSILETGGGVFVDAGAHAGLYTCVLGNMPGVTCVSVEPSARMARRLDENLHLNPRVRAIRAHLALSSSHRFGWLQCPTSGNSGSTRVSPTTVSAGNDPEVVSCAPLGDLLDWLRLAPIRLIKIDIEGNEFEVLKELAYDREHRPDNIICEYIPAFLPATLSLDVYGAFFNEKGYDLLSVMGEPLSSPDQILEANIWLRSRRQGSRVPVARIDSGGLGSDQGARGGCAVEDRESRMVPLP